MGIPMDDIHTPTVPSGPTSAHTGNRDLSNASLTQLFSEKERLEAELKALSDVLGSHGVTMSTTLTTFDGYPRDDLDIAQIRTTRAKVIYLRNDYKDVMAKIEQGIHSYFARMKDSDRNIPESLPVQPTAPSAEVEQMLQSQDSGIEVPFAKVNNVAAGSPAAEASMRAGDKVCSFGEINWMNHENLTKIGDVVQRNEGNPITVKVARPNETDGDVTNISLSLTPRRNWGGRGLLGCHLVRL